MSLNVPLPKQVFGHPWLIMSDGKMSKSKGNVIYADDLVDEFGVDAVRYYFLHEIPFASDGVFTRDLLIERINGDLANILGNLVQRTISMGNKYFEGKISNKKVEDSLDKDFISNIRSLEARVTEKMDALQISDAITEIFNLLRASNKYIDDTTPWILAKDENLKDRLETVLYNLLEAIRVSAVFLEPFLPSTSEKILEQINQECRDFDYNDHNSYELGTPSPLFMRIDTTKE
jgi:methionyl-tRNA synthetase